MMSKAEIFHFLNMTGGLPPCGDQPHPVSIFGIECVELELIAVPIQELVDAGWIREIRQIKEKFGEPPVLCGRVTRKRNRTRHEI